QGQRGYPVKRPGEFHGSAAVLTTEDVGGASRRPPVRIPVVPPAEDVRYRLDLPSVGQPVGLPAEGVRLRPDGAAAGPNVLCQAVSPDAAAKRSHALAVASSSGK